ncbi:MAG: TrkA family potassium uptake protein [Dehalococcoidia bacterium]|nr:TrkA family potassium uptake protein [Dehalococcoidia bacterium]
MYIIVVGGGNVGYHLTRELLSQGHEVLVIEKDAKKVDRINDQLGRCAIRGDGCEASVLEEAGAGRADILIAVTGEDDDNLVSCQVAKFRFNAPRTIARINDPNNDAVFRLLGVDATVSSTKVIMDHIEHEVPQYPLVRLMDLTRFGLELVDVCVPEDGPTVGRRLGEIALPPDTTISLVISPTDGPQVAHPGLRLGPGDELIAVTKSEHEAALRRALTGA